MEIACLGYFMRYITLIVYLFHFYSSFATDSIVSDLQKLNRVLTQISDILDLYARIPEIIPSPGAFTLPTLTDEEQKAGAMTSGFYAPGMDYQYLHDCGHTALEEFLEDFFFKTIFQNYVHHFFGYDMNFDYQQPYDIQKFNTILDNLELDTKNKSEQFNIISSLGSALKSFKENQLLRKLGTAYQRMKVVVDKLSYKTTYSKDEIIFKALTQADRLATDLQTMIFHMMKKGAELYKNNIKAAYPDQQEMKAAGNFLKNFKPTWVKETYYQDIIKQLEMLMKPKKFYIYLYEQAKLEISLD